MIFLSSEYLLLIKLTYPKKNGTIIEICLDNFFDHFPRFCHSTTWYDPTYHPITLWSHRLSVYRLTVYTKDSGL